MSADFDQNHSADSTLADPTNPDFRFEIIETENPARERPPACDHTQVLDWLNEALDRHAEVESLLETVCRALINGLGR
jgi:hypothetical protein